MKVENAQSWVVNGHRGIHFYFLPVFPCISFHNCHYDESKIVKSHCKVRISKL